METNGAHHQALPPGLLDELRADAAPAVRASEVRRVRRRLAIVSLDEPGVLAEIAGGMLEDTTAAHPADAHIATV